jgi:hypothetical protein
MPLPSAVRSVVPAALLATSLAAQCTYTWPATPFAGGADDTVHALAVDAFGGLIAGGRFANVGASATARIARWNGTSWAPLGAGVDGDVHALAVGPFTGMLFAGGTFGNAGGAPAAAIARWDGLAWTPLGSGVAPLVPFGASVQAIAAFGNGDVVIGGAFANVGGVPAANVARWNGSTWSALGSGCNGTVRGLVVAPNDVDVYATGSFTTAGGVVCNGIARWNGASWSPLGTGLGLFGGNAVAVAANGDVVVGGPFVTAGGGNASRVARWNGAGWQALGAGTNGPVTALLALPNGDVVAGGAFTTAGGAPAAGIAKWNGLAWQAIGTGTNGTVLDFALLPSGAVAAAGDFTTAGGNAAGRLAHADSSCAPVASAAGAGCSGSAGSVTLAALRLPLLGGVFLARGSGLPANALVVAVSSLAPITLPLPTVFPQAFPGCTLHVSPDVLDVVLPVAGTAVSSLSFPANPALLGATFLHQHVPLELGAGLAITGVSASNALQVALGSF